MTRSRCILVDGHAVLYRAFFAIRELSTADGLPTNAVFGFIRMLKQLRDAWVPDFMGVVFDGGTCRERVALLPEYKANRAPMPEALRLQIPLVQEFLEASGVAWARQEAQEADDVIASMAVCISRGECDVLIGTSDKDMMQLVNDHVRVVPVSGTGGVIGPSEVREKTGVLPYQIADWLALVGDSADNIPGVPGVGRKTAAKLLERFGTIEEMLERLDEIESRKVCDALKTNQGMLTRNQRLARLRTDLPCPDNWDAWRARAPSVERLLPYYEKLEFHAFARDLRQQGLFGSE